MYVCMYVCMYPKFSAPCSLNYFLLLPAPWPFRSHAPCSLNFLTRFSPLPKTPMQSLIDRKSGVKVTPPGGEVEIENVTFCIFNILNFSSATRWHFSPLTSLFPSMDPRKKSVLQIFDTWFLDKNIRQNIKNQCLHFSGSPRSMPNADQYQSKSWH